MNQREKYDVCSRRTVNPERLFAETIQEMLEAEVESSLGYAKHDMKNKRVTNDRNG
ncbi:hypothetical protein ACAF76_006220 [Brevibacillus sp. TJ4]